MDTRTIIDYAMNDDAKAMRDALYASIHDRVNAHIQAQKQEVAQNIFPEEVEEFEEEVEQIDELSLQTMKSAKEKLGYRALDAHYNDDKHSARSLAGRALQMGAKIKRKERSASSSVKEEVEELTEGKMDKMSLSHLWHKHASHSYATDQGYGSGSNNPGHNMHAATAIENHVRKHHGNKVADDMIDHSTHHVIHAEYAGPNESEHHEKEAAKLRAKHKISGGLYGNEKD